MLSFLLLLLAGCPNPEPTDSSSIACGTALTCTGSDVCVEQIDPAVCENREDTGVACPDGTTASQCGGAGLACCCGPTPDPTWQCWDAAACGDAPTCDCVVDACPSGMGCAEVEASGVFQCEELAKP